MFFIFFINKIKKTRNQACSLSFPCYPKQKTVLKNCNQTSLTFLKNISLKNRTKQALECNLRDIFEHDKGCKENQAYDGEKFS